VDGGGDAVTFKWRHFDRQQQPPVGEVVQLLLCNQRME
jgi:hypothetical protein